MSKKIIFFDIDGTLLDTYNGNNTLSSALIQTLTQLHHEGHILFVCTGRPSCLVPSIIRTLPFDGYIYGNGTHIEINNQLIYYSVIDDALVMKAVTLLKAHKMPYVLTTAHCCYAFNVASDYFQDLFISSQDSIITSPLVLSPSLNVSIISYGQENIAHADLYKTLFKDTLDFLEYEHSLADSYLKGHHKGKAIEYVVDYLNATIECTMAFGDGINDLEMIQTAHIGIAMGNAHPHLKYVANYVTTSVSDDGIVKALEYFNVV